MYFKSYIFYLFCIIKIKSDHSTDPALLPVSELANIFINTLGITDNETARIVELRNKLKEINKYVIDKEKYAQILLNETLFTSLNETNFFEALNESDYFSKISTIAPKNLYLKLKENMNRDDIFHVIDEKTDIKAIVKSARKTLEGDIIEGLNSEEIIESVVDKMIAETPTDNHKYNVEDGKHMYWDPKGELNDLNEYHQHDGRRIFKGERTTIKYYPFMVSIHIMSRFWCGGVIYWNDLIITAAACLQLMHNNRFFRENPRILQVRIGSNHSRISGELIDALEVYFHPGYNPQTLRNNIAVIRLTRHLYFSYHRVPKAIEISHSDMGLPATAEVLVLGWGVMSSSQKLSFEPIFLNKKFLPVYPNMFCKEVYGDKFVTQTMFCAGTFTTGEGVCDHDAGGPAVLSGKLVGIISFGPTVCGYPNAPAVFTRVGHFADWIETINETMHGFYRGRFRTTTTTKSPLYEYLFPAPVYIPKTIPPGLMTEPVRMFKMKANDDGAEEKENARAKSAEHAKSAESGAKSGEPKTRSDEAETTTTTKKEEPPAVELVNVEDDRDERNDAQQSSTVEEVKIDEDDSKSESEESKSKSKSKSDSSSAAEPKDET